MLTEQQLVLVNSVQAKLADAKSVLRDLSNQAGALRKALAETPDPASQRAANAAMAVQGVAVKLRGELIAAHAIASDALLDYDEAQGMIVVFGGGGGR